MSRRASMNRTSQMVTRVKRFTEGTYQVEIEKLKVMYQGDGAADKYYLLAVKTLEEGISDTFRINGQFDVVNELIDLVDPEKELQEVCEDDFKGVKCTITTKKNKDFINIVHIQALEGEDMLNLDIDLDLDIEEEEYDFEDETEW